MSTSATLLDGQLIELAEELGGVCKTLSDKIDSAKLPEQSGNDGRFLSTDGTAASWTEIKLKSDTDYVEYFETIYGGGDQSAEIEKLAWEIADEALQAQIDEIKTSYRERVLGQVIHSLFPLKESGVHLLDGTALYNGGIYTDFYNYAKGLKTDYPDMFIDEAGWSSCVNAYGSCGKFVLTDDYIRLPKISDILQGTTDTGALGDLIEAGLPNINGAFVPGSGNNTGTGFYDGKTTVTGAFSKTSIGSTRLVASTDNTYASVGINFDASNGGSTLYGNSTTVQPQTIRTLIYIVVATAVKTDIVVDIDNIVTDLNDKANKDLGNCTSPILSAPYITQTWSSGASWYRKYSDGWIEQGGIVTGLSLTSDGTTTISFHTNFTNSNVNVVASHIVSGLSGYSLGHLGTVLPTTTSFTYANDYQSSTQITAVLWRACGY